jgi:hypothetical protein
MDAVAALILHGLSSARRPSGRDLQDRGGRQRGPAARSPGRAGFREPDDSFITTLDELGQRLGEMVKVVRRWW